MMKVQARKRVFDWEGRFSAQAESSAVVVTGLVYTETAREFNEYANYGPRTITGTATGSAKRRCRGPTLPVGFEMRITSRLEFK